MGEEPDIELVDSPPGTARPLIDQGEYALDALGCEAGAGDDAVTDLAGAREAAPSVCGDVDRDLPGRRPGQQRAAALLLRATRLEQPPDGGDVLAEPLESRGWQTQIQHGGIAATDAEMHTPGSGVIECRERDHGRMAGEGIGDPGSDRHATEWV